MALLVVPPGPAAAQERIEGPGPWNGERALELVERAREVRQRSFVDTTLTSYRADATGYVYFFLDRPGSDERTPVKTDQIALEVYWRAPDQTHQRIVGRRDEKSLPTNIKYHLDHLTVVQDEFPDRIRLGDGDEVADVTHPVAPGSEAVYDVRLADSLTLALPGEPEPITVYELQVKPRRMELPGFVGSLFVDRETGAIVRMRFSFTPSSYVDPYLDYIRISRDNLRWEGGHWLPYRQTAEIRRELPQLDFAAGSIIRGRFEIGPYAFNEPVPEGYLSRGRVSAAPRAQLESYPFRDSLHAGLEEEGLGTPASIEEVRQRVREMAADRYLSGLRRFRFHLPSASRVYRFDRAQGHVVGAGSSYALTDVADLTADAGWSFGRDRVTGSLRLVRETDHRAGVSAYLHHPRDVGPFPAASTVVNTLGGLLYDRDWTDPWFASGLRLWIDGGSHRGGWLPSARAGVAFERQRPARLVLDDGGVYRPVRPVAGGDRAVADWGLAWGGGADADDGWGAELRGTVALGVGDGADGYDRTEATVAWSRAAPWRDADLSVRLDGGVSAEAAPQALFLLGGRETLPGHDFRRFVGDRYWLLRAEAATTVAEPWLTLRARASAGQARLDDPLPAGWYGDPDAGVRGSAGVGLGLLWEVLWLDLSRGLGPDGHWALHFEVAPRFHGWL